MRRSIPPACTRLCSALFLLSVLAGVTSADDADDLARYDAKIKPADRRHWSFQPVRRPDIPRTKDTRWARNPIDNFVLARLEGRGWQPSLPAEPRALLRRVYLDLTGLPPTLEEQDAFLTEPSPAAFERLINDLLARPAYGERWGRHWLDLVRYAESNGYERDAPKPNVWRYRDYVIRAFNTDKPFDHFILEQLAGDELPDSNAEMLLATGFNRLGPWDDEPADPAQDRFDQLDDLVGTTSEVFLGLTLACARCHNHKFEPLTMHDYYRMIAVFDPLQRHRSGRTELDLPVGSRQDLTAHRARLLEMAVWRTSALGYRLGSAGSALSSYGAVLTEEKARRLRAAVSELPRGYYLHEPSATAPATHLLARGQATRPGSRVEPGLPAVLVGKQPPFLPPDEHTTRRRLTLARWIASPDNPLTARVIVNRVWQYHFGEALVRTPSDFGVMGEPPTHPELLDWLADWFVREGWSLKKLHRLIVDSSTYRMSKRWDPDHGAQDPEDRLLWRVPYRRLEVEVIRDSALAASGRLNCQMYGPSVHPHVPKEALEGSSDPDKIWKASPEHEAARRTVYAHVKRSLVVPLLEVLDFCDCSRSTAKRNVTSVAPQALTLFNGDFVNRQAKHLAERLEQEAGPDREAQVERAFRLVVCRAPTRSERQTMLAFLQREKLAHRQGLSQRALEQLCRALFNLNEFVYPD